MPSNRPRMAEKITSQTCETEKEPTTQLTSTWPVLAIRSVVQDDEQSDRDARGELVSPYKVGSTRDDPAVWSRSCSPQCCSRRIAPR